MSTGDTQAAEPRHFEINAAITNHLESAVFTLEKFVAQVKGNDQATVESTPEPSVSLSAFIADAAGSINSRADRIIKAVGELREVLL